MTSKHSNLQTPKIVFVDDELSILKALKRELQDYDEFECVFFNDSSEALKAILDNPPHIVVSDLCMPGLDGQELMAIVAKQVPDVYRIVLTGQADTEALFDIINKGKIDHIIEKPWSHEQLLESLERGVEISLLKVRNQELEKLAQQQNIVLESKNRELKEARDRALNASEAKSAFLATMSHEIRTPLNSILGFVDLLNRSALSSEQRQWVSTSRESGRLLLSIINDILDYSKLEAGKLRLEESSFSLNSWAYQTVKLLDSQAQKKGLSLLTEIDQSLPKYVVADADRLRQVVLNLINNAIKFSESGAIVFSISMKSSNDSSAEIEFSIRDNGIGISSSNIEELFTEFYMVDSSKGRNAEGTGLGLSICDQLIKRMGSSISVDSELGVGSRFSFVLSLPIGTDQDDDEIVQDFDDTELAGISVLLAEDNSANQMLVTTLLEFSGAQVQVASDGIEVLECLALGGFDIILMDISMPRMDGIRATQAIRSGRGKAANIPIIALSAHVRDEDRATFVEAGMDDCLAKPVDTDKLIATLKKWANKGLSATKSQGALSVVKDSEFKDLVCSQTIERLIQDTSERVVPKLLTIYKDDAQKRIEEIKEAVKREDYKTLEFESHTLGSSSLAHGNPRLCEQCRKIENLCRAREYGNVVSLSEEMLVLAEKSLLALDEWAKSRFDMPANSDSGKSV